MRSGPRNLITDVTGLFVGNSQHDRIKTGVTVLAGDAPFRASVHVMGGAPGTRETDLLAPDKTVDAIDAIVLAGGSAFGLDACGGVMAALRDEGRGFAVGDITVPIVPGAIIFDLLNGGDKDWTSNPYPALGRAAYLARGGDFALGSYGAGTGALAAMQKGGLGSASVVVDGWTVGALVVANPMGSVTTPGERHFWAAPFEIGDEFGGLGPDPVIGIAAPSRKSAAIGHLVSERMNTTIAIVATDAPLTKAQCYRMAVAAHDGIARAIVPAHTPLDGDLVFGVATGAAGQAGTTELTTICAAAAACLSRAIARGIHAAIPAGNDLLGCWSETNLSNDTR